MSITSNIERRIRFICENTALLRWEHRKWSAIEYVLLDVHSKCSLNTFGTVHELTFLINHIDPPAYSKHTQLLRFYYAKGDEAS